MNEKAKKAEAVNDLLCKAEALAQQILERLGHYPLHDPSMKIPDTKDREEEEGK